MIRLFDIFFSALALTVLLPVLVPVVVVLRLTGEREVFFAQTRVGLGGRHFKLLKFATMLKDSPNIGTGEVTVKNDPRVLPFGRLLRKTKINELPQLWNVLRGDMSLIGPRPQALSVFQMFPKQYRGKIVSVPPGLSGVGSILFRDEESIVDRATDRERFYRDVVSPYKAEVECWFADHRSLGLYFTLIALTAWVIVRPGSSLPWMVLPGLPRPPEALRRALVAA